MYTELIKNKGLSVTQKRIALLKGLDVANKPITIEELRAQMTDNMDVSTMYRSLKKLVDAGIVYQTDFRDGVSYFEFGGITWLAIGVGLLIAGVKGYLVASQFMHLNDNNPTINWTLILTAMFLLLLFAIPKLWENDLVTVDAPLFDELGEEHHSNDGEHH